MLESNRYRLAWYNADQSYFTEGSAFSQNHRAGGPGGRGMPFLDGNVARRRLYNKVTTAAVAASPTRQSTGEILSTARKDMVRVEA